MIRHESENKLFYSELPRDRRGRYREQNGPAQVVSTVLVNLKSLKVLVNLKQLNAIQLALKGCS